MALVAYEAQAQVHGAYLCPLGELYQYGDPTRDHLLEPGQILTEVVLPPPLPNERSAYLRLGNQQHAPWPLAEVVVRLVLADDKIAFARIVVGGVARIPLRLAGTEEALVGQEGTNENLEALVEQIGAEASSPPMSAYKVKIAAACVLDALTGAVGGV